VSISPSAACVEIKPLPAADARATELTGEDRITANAVTNELRDLVSSASVHIAELRQLLDHALQQQAGAREASTNLHERLRLGARMLQAFGAQMNRLESEMARAQDERTRLEKSNQAAHGRIEAATLSAAERIERTARLALAAVEDRVKMLEARLRTIEEDRSACAAEAVHPLHTAVPAESRVIGELAEAMRALAVRVESMTAGPPARAEAAPPMLRIQKWADHG
jgi:chromosome segregation ATPase